MAPTATMTEKSGERLAEANEAGNASTLDLGELARDIDEGKVVIGGFNDLSIHRVKYDVKPKPEEGWDVKREPLSEEDAERLQGSQPRGFLILSAEIGSVAFTIGGERFHTQAESIDWHPTG